MDPELRKGPAVKRRSAANLGASRQGLIGIVLPVVGVFFWHLFTRDALKTAPTPLGTLQSLIEMIANGDLIQALSVSLLRIAVGFSIAAFVGIVIGFLIGSSKAFEWLLDPVIEIFRPIAPIAWIPLAILWFGAGFTSSIFIVGYAAFFPIVINTIAGVRQISPNLLRASKVFGAGRILTYRDVIWPGALPYILVGTRLGMGAAWGSIVAAEMTVGAKAGSGAGGGIGQMMFVFLNYSNEMSPIVVCMLAIGAVALLIDTVFLRLRKWLTPWSDA